MADAALRVLLDQNVPRQISGWLLSRRPHWDVFHTTDVALSNRPGAEVFAWAQDQRAVVVTFDRDFAIPGCFHSGATRRRSPARVTDHHRRNPSHFGSLAQLFADKDWSGSLIIVDAARIRVRRQAGR